MGSNAPPDGWSVINGTWGTDFDRIYDTSTSLDGDAYIRMKATANAQTLELGRLPYTEPDWTRIVFNSWLIVKADANTANDKIRVRYEFYDYRGSDITAPPTYSINRDYVVTTTGAWEPFGRVESTTISMNPAQWVRILISKPSNTNFNADIAGFYLQSAPPYAITSQRDGTFGVLNVWYTVPFINYYTANSALIVNINTAIISFTPDFTIQEPGSYIVTAAPVIDVTSVAQSFQARIKHVRAGNTTYFYGADLLPNTTGHKHMSLSAIINADVGDTVTLEVRQTAGALTVWLGDTFPVDAHFSIARLGP